MQLTEQQLKIVNIEDFTDNKKICLLASAGSGKSVTLAYRIENLIKNKKVNPNKIALFSYSRTASKEFKDKIEDLLGKEISSQIKVSTIHSLAHIYMSRYFHLLKMKAIKDYISDNFEIRAMMGISGDYYFEKKDIKNIVQRANFCKVKKIPLKESGLKSDEIECYVKADNWCKSINLISFNNLLLLFLELLERFPNIRQEISDSYDYIFIDESQDTTILQMDIFKQIIQDKHYLMTVGDIQQTIYEFAGSDPFYYLECMENWKADFFQLGETFRFGNTVVEYANKVVDKIDIDDKYKIKTFTNQVSEEVVLTKSEIDFVNDIIKLKVKGVPLHKISILTRTNVESTDYFQKLMDKGIPCYISGGSFYKRTEIQTVIKMVMLLINFNIDDLLFVFRQKKNNIDEKTLNIILDYITVNDFEINNVLTFLEYALNYNIKGIGQFRKGHLQDEYNVFNKLKEYVTNNEEKLDFIEIYGIIDIDSFNFMGHEINLQTGISNYTERLDNLSYLAYKYSDSKLNDIFEFFRYLKVEYENDDRGGEGKVILRTIHRSKGMTIPYTFLDVSRVGGFISKEDDIKSELFLSYVGITRAKNRLTILLKENKSDGHLLNFLFGNTEYERKFDDNSLVGGGSFKGSLDFNRFESICGVSYDEDFDEPIEIEKVIRETEKAVMVKLLDYDGTFFLPKSNLALNRMNNVIYTKSWLKRKNFPNYKFNGIEDDSEIEEEEEMDNYTNFEIEEEEF